MRHVLSIAFFLSCLGLLISPTLTTSLKKETLKLPLIVVQETPLTLPTFLENADTTYITARDLAQQQSISLADALKYVPGSHIIQQGGIGQKTDISLRGTATGHTAFVINGMRINDVSAENGAVDLALWLIDDIEEIQIIRGPLSSLYGSDAIGGIIKVETKKGQGPLKIFTKAEAGSYHTFQEVLSAQGQNGLINYNLTASGLQSAGSSLTPDRLLTQIQGKQNDPLHQENISARFGVGQDSAHVSFFTRHMTRRLGFRTENSETFFQDPWRQNMRETFNRLQGHFENADGKWIHDGGIGHYTSHRENENSLAQKDGDNKGSQTQIDWRQTVHINDSIQTQITTEFAREEFFTQRLKSMPTRAQTHHGSIGGAISMKGSRDFTVSGAIRVDKYQALTPTMTYRLSSEYRLTQMSFKGNLGTGFKAPSLAQRFYKSPLFSGNPHLKPEKSLGWDFGIEYFPAYLPKVNLGVTLFQNRIQDMIVFGGNTNVNLNEAKTQGIETVTKLHLTQTWQIDYSHTYTRAWDTRTGLHLVRRPRHQNRAQLIGQITPKWQISGHIIHVGRQIDLDFQRNQLKRIIIPSYVTIGIETTYHINKSVQIYGRGTNLLNHRYEAPYGYQQPGLGIYAGVRAQW